MVNDKRKWVKTAFHRYYANKARLLQLKEDYERVSIPGVGGGGGSGAHSCENGVEKSVLHYLADRERFARLIKDCENQIALVEKTLRHFAVEEQAKAKRHAQYIRCRFIQRMSYTRAAVECGLAERTSDFVLEEIMTVAYAIAEMEGYI